MKKNIVVFGMVLLFLGLAFTPTINSSFVNVNSEGEEEQNEDAEYVEIEVYDFKGKYGFQKTIKNLSISDFHNLKNEDKAINSKKLTIKETVKQTIQLFKKYNLISEEYSYEKIERMANEQKTYLDRIAKIGYVSYKINQIKEKTNSIVLNLGSFTAFGMAPVVGISLGFPPWRIIWPIVFPGVPAISAWASAAFAGGGDYGFLYAKGLMGEQITEEAHFSILLGFIGVSVFYVLPSYNPDDPRLITYGAGTGFSAFCAAV
jgi:hypothetical protein